MANGIATYIRQHNPKTKCPKCEGATTLLIKRALTLESPVFFICWNCERIYEGGHGLVETE